VPLVRHAPAADTSFVRRRIAAVVALACAGALASAEPGAAASHASALGHYVVGLEWDVSADVYRASDPVLFRTLRRDAARRQKALRARLAPLMARGEVRVVRAFWISNALEVRASARAVRAIRRMPGVRAVTRDGFAVPRTPPRRSRPVRGAPAASDPVRREHVGETPQPTITLIGAPTLWAAGADGAGMKVGVMDTDLDASHPVFGCATTWTQASKCGRVIGYGDFNFVDPFSREPNGFYTNTGIGHGTAVTSVLAGGAVASTGKVWGVAPGTSILFARIQDPSGFLSQSAILAASQWLADPDGNPVTTLDRPTVVNGSWGTSSLDTVLNHDVVRTFRAAGILPVFALGNNGPSQGSASTPGAFPDVLGVGNTDSSDVVRSDSSRGCDFTDPTVPPVFNGVNCTLSLTWGRADNSGPPPGLAYKPDVTAPGYAIPFACHFTTSCGAYGGQYEEAPGASGTSFSSPHVAGAALLLKQRHPSWTPGQIAQALRATALDLGPAGWDKDTGFGRIQVALADVVTPDMTAPALVRLAPQDGVFRRGSSGTDVAYRVTPAERLDDVILTGGVSRTVLSYDTTTGDLVVRYAGLPDGANTLTATVVDEAGNASPLAQAQVTGDATPPTLTVAAAPLTTPEPTHTFTGTFSDPGGAGPGYVTATPNGAAPVTVPVQPDGTWSYAVTFSAAGEQIRVSFTATDAVGNRSYEDGGQTPIERNTTWVPPLVAPPSPPPVATPPPSPPPSLPPPLTLPSAPPARHAPILRVSGLRVSARGVIVFTVRSSRAVTLRLRAVGVRWTRRVAVRPGRRSVHVVIPVGMRSRVHSIVVTGAGRRLAETARR
jgi:subtilisin family serine protease